MEKIKYTTAQERNDLVAQKQIEGKSVLKENHILKDGKWEKTIIFGIKEKTLEERIKELEARVNALEGL